MKKYTILVEANEEFSKQIVFAEKQSDIEKPEGFVSIIKAENVTHPAPHVLAEVVNDNYENGVCVSLAEFYAQCEPLMKEYEKVKAERAAKLEEKKNVVKNATI